MFLVFFFRSAYIMIMIDRRYIWTKCIYLCVSASIISQYSSGPFWPHVAFTVIDDLAATFSTGGQDPPWILCFERPAKSRRAVKKCTPKCQYKLRWEFYFLFLGNLLSGSWIIWSQKKRFCYSQHGNNRIGYEKENIFQS